MQTVKVGILTFQLPFSSSEWEEKSSYSRIPFPRIDETNKDIDARFKQSQGDLASLSALSPFVDPQGTCRKLISVTTDKHVVRACFTGSYVQYFTLSPDQDSLLQLNRQESRELKPLVWAENPEDGPIICDAGKISYYNQDWRAFHWTHLGDEPANPPKKFQRWHQLQAPNGTIFHQLIHGNKTPYLELVSRKALWTRASELDDKNQPTGTICQGFLKKNLCFWNFVQEKPDVVHFKNHKPPEINASRENGPFEGELKLIDGQAHVVYTNAAGETKEFLALHTLKLS